MFRAISSSLVCSPIGRPRERLRRTGSRWASLFCLCLAVSGCAGAPAARYVYQDGEFGVIGIPRNTIRDQAKYRAQAEVLMDRHFPEGYEIVRAEEVVEGQRTLELGKKTEIDAEPILRPSNQLLQLGKVCRTSSYDEKDQLPLRECRIIYRRKSAGTPGKPSPFAAVATLTPALYVNPNEAVFHHAGTPMLAKADPVPEPARDSEGEKVSSPSPQ